MNSNFLFDSILVKKPKLNAFDLSFENRLSCEFGQLIPIVSKEVLPGDHWQMSFNHLIRLAPMVSPLLGRIDVDIRCFFVPNRIIHSSWEDFITGGVDGSSVATLPTQSLYKGTNYNTGNVAKGTLADYLNFHTVNENMIESLTFNKLPFYAYQQIYNDWYRDELLDPIINYTSGNDYQVLRYRRFRKDYFTSSRPNAQLGSPVSFGTVTTTPTISSDGVFRLEGRSLSADAAVRVGDFGAQEDSLFVNEPDPHLLTYKAGLKVDQINVSLGTIANLRRAFKIQEWQEKNSRGGNRYIENILTHFGVKSSDARLQRSQYIGGFSSPVVISDVQQQSASSVSTTPIGTLAGKGTSVGNSPVFKFKSEEHGFLFVIMSVLPHVGYTQGIDKKFLRLDKFDYAWPEFANIGEQAVSMSEIYSNGDNSTFGYQSRYAEYKSSFDEVHGEFLSSLDSWVQCRNFASSPSLNSLFVDTNNALSTLNRIFATQNVPGSHHLYCQFFCDLKALRPLPKYSIPSML